MSSSETQVAEASEAAAPGLATGTSSTIKALVGRGGQIALNMASGILTARALKPDGRGELAAMILWPIFLSGAFTIGIPSALLYSIRLKAISARNLIGTAMLLGLILSLFTAAAGIFLLPLWLVHYSPEVVRMAQWFMITTPNSILLYIGRAALEARGRFGMSSVLTLSPPCFIVLSLLLLLPFHFLTPISAACVYVLSGILPLVLILFQLRHELIPQAQSIPGATKALLSYGVRSYGIDLCGTLSQYVDQALVLKLLSPADMGSYTVALSLSRMINIGFTSVAAVLFPKAINQDLKTSYRMSLRALVASLMLAVPAALVLLFCARLALRVLYGREYDIATGLLKILILEAILSGCITVMSQTFMAIGRPGTVTLLQSAGLATAIPLVAFLVPRYGSEGAGAALVISALIRGFLLWLSYRKLLPDPGAPIHRQMWIETRHIVRTHGAPLVRWLVPAKNSTM